MKERDIFSQYIEMINRFEYVSNKGNDIHPSSEDEELLKLVRGLAASNETYQEIIKKIHSLPPKERHNYIDNYSFDSNTNKDTQGVQYIKKNKEGYINNILYFTIASTFILVSAILIALFYYYIS